MRRYPEIDGPAVLLLFCLAPHGVFPAARITSHAVSSYLAFSPLPALFSKNRRYHFCDTFRRRNFTNAAPAFFTRHAAVWCSDFPPANLAIHQRSSAISAESITNPKEKKNRGYRRDGQAAHKNALRFLSFLRLGAGLFGDIASAVESAFHIIVLRRLSSRRWR